MATSAPRNAESALRGEPAAPQKIIVETPVFDRHHHALCDGSGALDKTETSKNYRLEIVLYFLKCLRALLERVSRSLPFSPFLRSFGPKSRWVIHTQESLVHAIAVNQNPIAANQNSATRLQHSNLPSSICSNTLLWLESDLRCSTTI